MDLTVGPNFFFWDAATVRGFYQSVAAAPVARVVLGEVVCSKRLPFWQDEIPLAVESLLAAGKAVAISSLALITLKRERKQTAELLQLGLPVEINDLSALHHVPQGTPFYSTAGTDQYNKQDAKRAKDMGSAAVLLSLLLCAGIWIAALLHRLLA